MEADRIEQIKAALAALNERGAATRRSRLRTHHRAAPSQSELADMIGGTRESVNRQLRDWQKQGVLNLNSGWIVIEDAEAIAALARAD